VTRTLLLMRHGEIAANTQRRWHGATDSPLTPAGRRQARRLARRIQKDWGDVEAVYTSPLIRCVHTAQQVGAALGQTVILDDDLREWGIGELEDTTFDALHSEYDFFRRIRDDQDYAPDGGDTINEVKHRIVGALRRIYASHDGARPIAVVSHGAALGIALASLLDADANRWTNYHFDNCSVTQLLLEPQPVITAFNSTEHL
jgi:broad specificity phosphatase PhoE